MPLCHEGQMKNYISNNFCLTQLYAVGRTKIGLLGKYNYFFVVFQLIIILSFK